MMQSNLWFPVLCYLRDIRENNRLDGHMMVYKKHSNCPARKCRQAFLSVVVLPVLFLSAPPNFGFKILSLAGYISFRRNALAQPLSK